MATKLKNYTTQVAASRSIDLNERLLVDFGAFNIMKEYDDFRGLPGRRCAAISFIIEVDSMRMPFKLPANVQKVAAWLRKQRPNIHEKTLWEQAERIAWKQQYEILHLQLGQIEINQVERLEVFFPYLYDVQNRQTYYEKLKAGGFKQLAQG